MGDQEPGPTIPEATAQLSDAVEDTFEQVAAKARTGLEALLHKTAASLNALGISVTITYK